MKFWEAMKALEEGKSVRCNLFGEGRYVSDGHSLSAACSALFLSLHEIMNADWKVYEEPVPTYSFMEMIDLLKKGKKFKREGSICIVEIGRTDVIGFMLHDIEANDWILVE